MKHRKKTSTLKLTISALLAVSLTSMPALVNAADSILTEKSKPTTLELALTGIKRQGVEKIERTGLNIVINDAAQDVAIEGWSTKKLTGTQSAALLDSFGVRVVENGGKESLLAPSDVGRAGIMDGEVYMKMDGKVYKGLTLKGYGANMVHPSYRFKGAQPNGSLEYAESIRDMEVSSALLKGKVDTYLGVLSVERPNGMANYVRLSRTALRMNHLIDMRGQDLEKVMDYLADNLKDEVGKNLTRAEFADWIVKQSADVLARREYIRFQHASITDSNLGIGELVDLGDDRAGTGLMLPGEYDPKAKEIDYYDNTQRTQADKFKQVVRRAFENMKTVESSLAKYDFDAEYDSAYKARLEELRAIDQAKVVLNRATEAELTSIGFTKTEAKEVIKYNAGTADGIIDVEELRQIKSIAKKVDGIMEKATTDFMKLSDGSTMSRYYIENIGGADGVRDILKEARDYMKANNISVERDAKGLVKNTAEVSRLESHLRKLALEKAEALGRFRVAHGNSLTNFSKFIAIQTLEVIAKR